MRTAFTRFNRHLLDSAWPPYAALVIQTPLNYTSSVRATYTLGGDTQLYELRILR